MNKIAKVLDFFGEVPIHETPAPIAAALSLALYLNIFLTAFFVRQPWGLILVCLLAARYLIVRAKYFVPEAMLSILTVAVFFGVPMIARHEFMSFDYLGSSIALMVLLRSTRLKTSSDARYLLLLLILLSSALPLGTPTIWVSVTSMLLLVLNVGCLLRLHARGLTWDDLLGSARMFLMAIGYAAPMMILLFMLFQNANRQRSGFGNGGHESGFSTHLEPGEVANLVQRSDTAYRVKTDPELKQDQKLFWRVATLAKSNGLEWDNPDFEEGHLNENDVPEGCRLFQDITTVGEENSDYPLALDPEINFLAIYSKVGSAVSSICPVVNHYVVMDEKTRAKYLKLDFTPSPRVQELVKSFSADSEIKVIHKALAFLASGGFHLTLQPKKVPRGTRGFDEFLFNTHEGFCEHYAAALASLLRVAGIPARVVIGYKGGTRNPFGNYWRLAYSDAHAWTEAWDGSDWLRIDVTELLPPVFAPHDIWTQFMSRLWLTSDGFAYFGTEIGDAVSERWTKWKGNVGWSALFLTALASLLFWRRRQGTVITRFERSFAKLCKQLSKQGLNRGRTEGFEAFRQRVVKTLPEKAVQTIDETFHTYIQLRYGRTPPNSETIARVLKGLKVDLNTK